MGERSEGKNAPICHGGNSARTDQEIHHCEGYQDLDQKWPCSKPDTPEEMISVGLKRPGRVAMEYLTQIARL